MTRLFHAGSVLSHIVYHQLWSVSAPQPAGREAWRGEWGAEDAEKASSEFLLKIPGKCERASKYSNVFV